MTKGQLALHYAISQIGVHESPWGSNRGGIQRSHPRGGVDYYQSHDFLAGYGYPWCCDLVLTSYAETGHPLPYKTAGAYDFLRYYKNKGWAVPSHRAVPGDPIIFNEGTGHIALLERIKGDMFYTVDGNVSDRVSREVRRHSQIAGAIHIPDFHNVVPVKIPWSVTVTSASGHKLRVVTTRCTQNALLKWVVPALIKKYGRAAITIRRGGKK